MATSTDVPCTIAFPPPPRESAQPARADIPWRTAGQANESLGSRVLVANPSLRWGKPSGGVYSLRTLMPTDWQKLSLSTSARPRWSIRVAACAAAWGVSSFLLDRRLVPRGAVGNQPRSDVPRGGPAADPSRKTAAGDAGKDSGPRRHACWPAIGKWRPWRSSIATWRSRRGRPGWNNWPASGCRRISVAMRPGWPRKCRSCGKSATNCTAAWPRCAASSFPNGRPGHVRCRTASSGSRPTPGGARSKPPVRPPPPRRCVVGRSVLRRLARDLRARPRRRAGDRHRGRRIGRPCPGRRRSRGGGRGNPAARRTVSRHADRR